MAALSSARPSPTPLTTIARGSLRWQLVGNTAGFGNLLDGQHPIWFGDFSGVGRQQALFYYVGDGHWWLGTITRGTLGWSLVATARFGNLFDGAHSTWLGDFSGRGRTEVLFYYAGDGRWWLGSMAASTMTWSNVANTGFGNLLDGAHRAWQGDFAGAGADQILFYYRGDGNWWLGQMAGGRLTWTLVANTAGFGNLLDDRHALVRGEFSGNGRSSLVFYYNGDGNWWLGASDGSALNWKNLGSTSGFGNLLSADHRILTGDFTGDGKRDVLFYYAGDGNWWLGASSGSALTWSQMATRAGAGDLAHRFFVGDYDGDGKSDVAIYDSDDGSFAVGRSDGAHLGFHAAGSVAGGVNLLDSAHLFYGGDYDGDGKSDFVSYGAPAPIGSTKLIPINGTYTD